VGRMQGKWYDSIWAMALTWLISIALFGLIVWQGHAFSDVAKVVVFGLFIALQLAWLVLLVRQHRAPK